MMPLGTSNVALAFLIPTLAAGETIIGFTPIYSSLGDPSPRPPCPLSVLRNSIREQCDLDAQTLCAPQQQHPMNSLLFSPTTSFGGIRVRTLSPPPPPPPMFAMGSPLFEDLESVIDEMFSSSLQIFDEAFSEALSSPKVAEERAMEAFDKKLPSLVDEIASSISSSSSSSSSSDYPASEDERDVNTQREEVFAGVLGELADFSRHLQLIESRRRRRLSEIDPHTQMRNRLARRLTEYVSTTEVFQLPGGGVMRVVRVNPVEEENPRLGFMFREMDDCVYSRYQNGDLSDNCNQAVSSLMDFVAARRSNHLQHQRAVALPPLALNQEQVKEEQQAWKPPHVLLSQKAGQTYRRVVNGDDGATLRYMAFGWILASAALTIALCVLAAKNIWALTACFALILSYVFVGPFSMLAMLTVIIVWCRVYQEFFEEDDEEDDNAVTFDYVKMEEEEDDDKEPNSDTAQTMSKPQVFVGVPVQVV